MQINSDIIFTPRINKNSTLATNSPKKQFFSENIIISPTFKGSYYPSGYYTDTEVADTYKYLNRPDDTWRSEADSDLMKRYGFFKYVFGGGAEELEKHLREMGKLREDLQEQNRKIEAEKQKQTRIAAELVHQEEIKKKLKPAKMQFEEEFLGLVGLASKNEDISIPNAVMIKGSSGELLQNFTDWILSSKEINSAKYLIPENKSNDEIISDIRDFMQNAKSEFDDSGKHSVLFIENFEKITTQKDSNKAAIAALKSLMCCCAPKYHCSIIFATNNIGNFDPVLLVDSRVQSEIKLFG